MHFPLTQTFASPRRPILKLFGLSVDATMALLLTHVGMMVFLALWMAFGPKGAVGRGDELASSMIFNTASFRVEEAIRLFLYPFRHDLLSDHILFVIEMILLFFCGRSLENQIGRKAMIFYYGILVLFPPVLLLALSKVIPVHFVLNSSFHLTVALCLSYLLFVPQHQFNGGVHLRFLTWLLIGFCSVFFIAKKDWASLGYMAVTLSVSLLYLESIGAGNGAGILYLFRPMPVAIPDRIEEEKAVPLDREQRRLLQDSVDVLLEKISLHGFKSLTMAERRALVDASQRLGRHE